MYQDCHQIHILSAEWGTEGEWCEQVTGPSTEAWKRPRIPFADNHNDEMCINGYKPENMQQLSLWWDPSSPHPKRQDKLAPLYRVLIAFFDIPVVSNKNVWQKRATKWNLGDW